MATHTYRIFDRTTGQPVIPDLDSVLDTVALSSVQTTSGSAEITVASTSGVYPFMSCVGPGIPEKSWVAAVKNSTVLVLARVAPRPAMWVPSTAYVADDLVYHFATDMVFRCTVAHTSSSSNFKAGGFSTDLDAGKWTPVKLPLIVPSKATASASSLTAHCHGLSPEIPVLVRPGQVWRNEFTPTLKSTDLRLNGSSVIAIAGNAGGGYVPVPGSLLQVASGALAVNEVRAAVPDSMAGLDERSREVWQDMIHFVHTGGTISKLPVTPDLIIVRTGAGT